MKHAWSRFIHDHCTRHRPGFCRLSAMSTWALDNLHDRNWSSFGRGTREHLQVMHRMKVRHRSKPAAQRFSINRNILSDGTAPGNNSRIFYQLYLGNDLKGRSNGSSSFTSHSLIHGDRQLTSTWTPYIQIPTDPPGWFLGLTP